MASSFGRLALGVVGALIAPFGLAAVGFSIGSAIGGFLFAPEVSGPDVEGPRVGDTDVTTSTLGKTLTEHYGVTRSAGNVMWSAGLKEVKTETSTGGGGGKGGGGDGGGTQTSYSYFANFATAFGRGPASTLIRIWADGKLIYDINGSGDVQNDKYKFRFRKGGGTQSVDNLIKESINRRLQGLPDVNEGNGPQSSFRTISDLINDAQIAANAGDKRAAIYADYLTTLNTNATPGTPNDYGFTPAYRDVCMLVFENMPLEDFGNRIPNITAEIAWGTFSQTVTETSGQPRPTAITQNSSDTTVPVSGVSVDVGREVMIVQSGNRLRKFSANANTEVLNVGGGDVLRMLGADASGDIIARMTSGPETTLGKISSSSLLITGLTDPTTGDPHTMDNGAETITFGASLGTKASTSLFGGLASDGYFYAIRTNTQNLFRQYGGPAGTSSVAGIQYIGDGPMCNGGEGLVYALVDDGTNYRLTKTTADWGEQGANSDFYVNITPQNLGALTSLSGQTVSSIIYDPSADRIYGLLRTGTTSGRIIKYKPDGTIVYNETLTLAPPNAQSGLQRSSITGGKLVYARGTSIAEVDLNTGEDTIYTTVLTGTAAPTMQLYMASKDTLYTWVDTEPFKIEMGKNSTVSTFQSETTLQSVIGKICARTGMKTDEYDVSGVNIEHFVRGYSIGRPSSGRSALEKLLLSYFIDGIESDYTVKFTDRTTTPIRTILENELGTLKGPTGTINFLEARQPEYGLPSEINIAFTDQNRDYQQGAAHFRRVAQPVQSMYSEKTDNIELPIVFTEPEAANIAQRLLFLSWLARDSGKAKMNWSHLDLDPGDIISIQFNNGRTITDRIGKAVVGANFEIEMETSRSGDPVYEASTLSPIVTGGVPSNGILTPVYSELFVLDTPLLEDFHDLGRTALRYYTAIGADTTSWLSATLYASFNNTQFQSFDTANVDITWGQCQNVLGSPRAVWSTDIDNTLTVVLSVNNGDIASVTREEIINNKANRAFVWNPSTGVAELIQFQDVTVNLDNSITISNISRGLRGTDYAAYTHEEGEYFLFISDAAYLSQVNPLEVLGSIEYFKAVSLGGLLASATTVSTTWQGRDLRPYAPSRVNRVENVGDIDINWTRRTRLGGEWNMIGSGIETVPLNEDSEAYEFYLIDSGTTALASFDPDDASTYLFKRDTATPTYKVTAAELVTYGFLLNSPLNVAVAQVSAQVGRGFVASGLLAP